MWHEGIINECQYEFEYSVKVYDEPSKYGIEGGRISKLEIRENKKVVCQYDREWVIKPSDQRVSNILKKLMEKFN